MIQFLSGIDSVYSYYYDYRKATYNEFIEQDEILDLGYDSDTINNYPYYVNDTENYNSIWNVDWLFARGVMTDFVYFAAVNRPHISVSYYAKAEKNNTGTKLSNGDLVNVGDQINLSLKPFKDTDIAWNGTGFFSDTPYGRWVDSTNSVPPEQCSDHDYFGKIAISGVLSNRTDNQYYPFLVVKPEYSIQHNGTAELNCSNNGFDCVVETSGTIDSDIVINDTTGKFYYQYLYDVHNQTGDSGCTYHNAPLKIEGGRSKSAIWEDFTGKKWFILGYPEEAPIFIHDVSEKRINFNFTAEDKPLNLEPPAITGSAEGFNGNDYAFSISGTHPNNQSIKFYVDPYNQTYQTPYIESGWTSKGVSEIEKTYSNDERGINYLSAITTDINGNVSDSSNPHSIEIYPKPIAIISDQSWRDSTIEDNEVIIGWRSNYADYCTSDDFEIKETDRINVSSPDNLVYLNQTEKIKRYSITCTKTLSTGEKASDTDFVDIEVDLPEDSCPNPDIVVSVDDALYSGECQSGYNPTDFTADNNGWTWDCGDNSCKANCEEGSSLNIGTGLCVFTENQCDSFTVAEDSTIPSTSAIDYCKNGITPTNITKEGNGWSYSCDYSTSCSAICESGTSLDEDDICRANEVDIDVDTSFNLKKRIVSSESESCIGESGISSENDIDNVSCYILNDSGDVIHNINTNGTPPLVESVDEDLLPGYSYNLSCVYDDGVVTEEFNSEPQKCMLNPNFEEF